MLDWEVEHHSLKLKATEQAGCDWWVGRENLLEKAQSKEWLTKAHLHWSSRHRTEQHKYHDNKQSYRWCFAWQHMLLEYRWDQHVHQRVNGMEQLFSKMSCFCAAVISLNYSIVQNGRWCSVIFFLFLKKDIACTFNHIAIMFGL